jgi:hypothetical protein
MKKYLEVINKLLLYGFFVLGVVLLFLGTVRTSTMVIAFLSFFASITAAWIFKMKHIDTKYILPINIALWLNMVGELYVYYFNPLPFDKVLHIMAGIVLASIIYSYYKKNSVLGKDAVLVTVLGMLAFWEIYEYSMDTFFGFQLQGVFTNGILVQSRIDDTIMDLILGVIGASAYLIFKKEKIGESIKKSIKNIKIRK